MITNPIHVATISGHAVRYFKSPLNDGQPDFVWHSVNDLANAAGLTPEMAEHFLRTSKQDHPQMYRTIATIDGLETIAPHCVAQGFTRAMAAVGKTSASFVDDYLMASVEADAKHPTFSLDDIAEAVHRWDGTLNISRGV